MENRQLQGVPFLSGDRGHNHFNVQPLSGGGVKGVQVAVVVLFCRLVGLRLSIQNHKKSHAVLCHISGDSHEVINVHFASLIDVVAPFFIIQGFVGKSVRNATKKWIRRFRRRGVGSLGIGFGRLGGGLRGGGGKDIIQGALRLRLLRPTAGRQPGKGQKQAEGQAKQSFFHRFIHPLCIIR